MRGKDKSHALPRNEFHVHRSHKQIGVTIVQPARSFFGPATVAVSLMLLFESRVGAENIKRDRAVECGNLDSVLDRPGLDPPIACMRIRVEVAIVDKRLHSQASRPTAPEQRVWDVGSVLTLAHPDARFEQSVGRRESPYRTRAFQVETLKVEVALGLDGAAGPAICSERVARTVVVGRLFQLCDELRSSERRMEGGDQQAMIAAGQIAADGSGGVAADTVRNEPFPLFGNFQRPAYLTPEFYCHAARRAGRFGFRRAGLSLCVGHFKAAPF